MVTSTIDPIRIPTINLSEEELNELEALIDQGSLPKDFLDRHFDAVQNNVFGFDHKKDKDGRPLEQGIGSPFNMTRNCIEAYRKYGKGEDNYEATLKRMEVDLVESDKRRRAAADNNRGKARRRY